MTRREALLSSLAALSLRAQQAPARKTPSLCILSSALGGIGYAEMGEIVKQLGFDGVDITVMRGGLVEPHLAPVDEVRALESIHGAGLEAPIITTALYTPFDAWARTVLALAGRTGVGLFRSGLDQRTASPQTGRDTMALASMGREYKIALLIEAGSAGTRYSPADALRIVAPLDEAWTGISLHSDCFMPGAGVSDEQLRPVLGRVRAASVGDSTADLGRMFRVLAGAGFTGPITFGAKSGGAAHPEALARDAEAVRKQIRMAYHSGDSAT